MTEMERKEWLFREQEIEEYIIFIIFSFINLNFLFS